MRFVCGYQDTRTIGADLALTPYLFRVWVNGKAIIVVGIGLCWLYYSFYIGFGFGLPKGYGGYKNHNKPL